MSLTDEERDAILLLLNEHMKEMRKDVDTIKTELGNKPDRDEVTAMVRSELADYPKRDEIRSIMREELHNASFIMRIALEEPSKQ